MSSLRADADHIIAAALAAAQPDRAVQTALAGRQLGCGRLYMLSIGKAGWQMAKAACDTLGSRIAQGIVITKYRHGKGALPNTRVFEAGHPVPDANGVAAAQEAIRMVRGLTAEDTVLFLVSGGGSALFEKPLVPLKTLEDISRQLLKSGADITQMNVIRKRLSAVKGGRFALLCAPARVLTIALSDVLGDDPATIASGPTVPDPSTSADALAIAKQYSLALDGETLRLLSQETPKTLQNVETVVAGSVRHLCAAAAGTCKALSYEPVLLTDSLCCTARDAGSFLASVAHTHQDSDRSLAYIAGGETVVRLTGSGLGGRNQELALAAAIGLDGLKDTALFSVGSDGTDGPTDAAGGYVDARTAQTLREKAVDLQKTLDDNDSYHALSACGGLIVTGPTGTNVNDLTVLLIKR
ncbi:MAG: glycerate kinase [Bacillota bacterium]